MLIKLLTTAMVLMCIPGICMASGKQSTTLPVIGEVESLVLVKEKMQFSARIDTGAKTSSFSAVGIQPFERDGKRWIRFHVIDPVTKKQVVLERPLQRTVKIKRHGELAAERPVVQLLVAIGNLKEECDFSLVDRSDYEYPVLVGRNFLSGKVMVDVSRKMLAHPINQKEDIQK